MSSRVVELRFKNAVSTEAVFVGCSRCKLVRMLQKQRLQHFITAKVRVTGR